MKTRYSSLVSVKKNAMQKSERVVQDANKKLRDAQEALQKSIEELQEITSPQHGFIAEFLANRTLLDSQRALIKHNEEWVHYANSQLQNAREALKYDMIEYEKFKYLELQEIEKFLKEKKIQEAKDLDEIALMTFGNKNDKRQAL